LQDPIAPLSVVTSLHIAFLPVFIHPKKLEKLIDSKMKFGRNLPRNQVPEWAPSYIKYKALKKLIKSAAEEAKHGEGADTAGM